MSEAVVIMRHPGEAHASRSGTVLIIDDEAAIRESLETLLELEGYAVESASSGEEGLARLGDGSFDLVLLDLALPDRNGIDLLAEIHAHDPHLSVIMITAYGTVENAVRAMQAGASNFVQKPWDNEKLLADVRTAVARHRAEEENIQLKRALKQRYNFENIVGKSEPMLKIFDLVTQVAASRSTVLLQGESGTGKELIAKAIHLNSPRRDRPFVPVNSGSLPPDLLESTLFGHVQGAFTTAIQTRKGYFDVANHGTIFFDEVGTIAPETQVKLLRVIQEKEFQPLGSNETIRVDVRIIAATNIELRRLVDEGKFREDLYYRLNVINIVLPPLRERKEDIPALVDFFFTKYCRENEKYLDANNRSILRFQPDAMQILMDHIWPGNVRELENVVERAVVLAAESTVPLDVLPEYLLQANGIRLHRADGGPLPADASLFEIVADFERRIIIERLEQFNWSQTEAADSLHVPLSTLNQKIKRLNIEIRRKSEVGKVEHVERRL